MHCKCVQGVCDGTEGREGLANGVRVCESGKGGLSHKGCGRGSESRGI